MKAPLLIVGCQDPREPSVRRQVVARFQSAGFTVEPVRRELIAEHLERLSFSTQERPDAVLLAPEFEGRRPGYYRDVGRANASALVQQIRNLPDHLCLSDHVRAKTVPVVLAAYGDDPMFYGAFLEEAHGLYGRPPALRWFHSCRDPGRLLSTVVQAIRAWRYSLFEQFDYFGYSITRDDAGVYRVGHALLRPRESDILAVGASLRASTFYILQSDALDDVPAYRELETLLITRSIK